MACQLSQNTMYLYNDVKMLIHRLQRWHNIIIAVTQRLIVAGLPYKYKLLNQCWFNVEPASPTLAQH